MTERLILQFLRLQNALFYKFLAFRTPYFTVFASFQMAFQLLSSHLVVLRLWLLVRND